MKKLITLIISISLILSAFTLVSNAEDDNLALMSGVAYHWSGTWENNGQDSTAGDPGSKCFDGDTTTKWGSANVSNGDQWLSVVFPSAVQITGFKTWQDSGPWTNITGFKAQVQNGNDTWQDVYTSPEYSETWASEEKTFDSAITATAFRILIPAANAGGKSAVELTELEIYGSEVSNPQTGDASYFIFVIVLFAACLLKKRNLLANTK